MKTVMEKWRYECESPGTNPFMPIKREEEGEGVLFLCVGLGEGCLSFSE